MREAQPWDDVRWGMKVFCILTLRMVKCLQISSFLSFLAWRLRKRTYVHSPLNICSLKPISMWLKNVYDTEELIQEATSEKISVVRQEGNRNANRNLQFYSLDAIIAVGYRVNSIRATQFRQWATSVLRQYAIRGYVLK